MVTAAASNARSGVSNVPIARPGQVLFVGRQASVQFDGDRGFNFRVIRVADEVTYTGWQWLTGYVLDDVGEAVVRRSIFVQSAGLRPPRRAGQAQAPRAASGRSGSAAGSVAS